MTTIAPPRPLITVPDTVVAPIAPVVPTIPVAPVTPRPTLTWDWTITASAIRDWVARQPAKAPIGSCRSARYCMVAVALNDVLGLASSSAHRDPPTYVSVAGHATIYRRWDRVSDHTRSAIATVAIADDLTKAIHRYDRLRGYPTRERVLRDVFGPDPTDG